MVALLAPLHGFYNAVIGVLVFYQAWLGLKIRHARRTSAAFPIAAVKRHRKNGHFLPVLAALGFAAGLVLIMLDHRPLLAFPSHFFLGLAIVLLLLLQKQMGARIKGPSSPIRTPHFLLGLGLLAAYAMQAYLGLSLLF